jgi:hypothetical protein
MIPSTQQAEANVSVKTAHTIDGEGLLNNYAIEPEMYVEDGGEVSSEIVTDRVTVVDIFDSEADARNAVTAMEEKGLRSQQISVIAKDYHDLETSMHWQGIVEAGGLGAMLNELGISEACIVRFVDAVEHGKFLVVASGSDRQASQAKHVLEALGDCMMT